MTLLLDKPKAKEEADAVSPQEEVQEYRWTVDALYRAMEAGVFFDPKRLELIHGRIIRKMSQDPAHASLRRRLSRRLRHTLEPPFLVMEESPLRLALDGEPVPDLFIVTGVEEDFDNQHPTQAEAVLVIEVANTTVVYDTGEKARLYAESGIAEYWVVLVNDMAVVRHREPSANGYKDVIRLAGADTISPLAAPKIVWTVRTLIGREEAPKEN